MAATKAYFKHLMAAAVALPGVSTAATSIDSGDIVVDFKHLLYEEQNDLMSVDADYISVAMAITDQSDLSVSIEYETISGASPIFMSPDADGMPVLVKSGASITDQRTAVSASFNYFLDSGKISVSPSWSDENDYTSNAVTVQYEWGANSNNTTFAVGAGFADERVWATGDLVRNDKEGSSAFFGVTQVISTKSLMQFNVSFSNESGFLSDPYKLTQIQDTIAADARPDDRTQISGLARYIRHMGEGFSVRLAYRYFQDDWDVQSHTLEAAWYQELSSGWLINPSVRYYTQDKARFYEPYFVELRDDGYYSSDFRLASFGSIMAGLTVGKTIFGSTRFTLGVDFYERRGELKLGGEHSLDPEPLSSYVVTVGLKHTF